jgi:hypothetical protein
MRDMRARDGCKVADSSCFGKTVCVGEAANSRLAATRHVLSRPRRQIWLQRQHTILKICELARLQYEHHMRATESSQKAGFGQFPHGRLESQEGEQLPRKFMGNAARSTVELRLHKHITNVSKIHKGHIVQFSF